MQKISLRFLQKHMLPSGDILFQGHPFIIQEYNAKPQSADITKAWLRKKGAHVLASSPIPNRENVENFQKENVTMTTPYCCNTLRVFLQEELDKITLETLHHLVSSARISWQDYKVVF